MSTSDYRPYIQYGFSNALMQTSVGGLILCGMNEGIGETSDADQPDVWLPWTPYFSHVANKDFFQTILIEWFRRWGYPLNPDEPSTIDLAISQTNLFIDASSKFAQVGRSNEDWVVAIEALAMTARTLKASGLLIISKTLGDNIAWYVDHAKFTLPEWGATFGAPLMWTDSQYGQVKWRKADNSTIPLACVAHPNAKVAYESVSDSAASMKPWLDEVLDGYLSVQAKMQPNA